MSGFRFYFAGGEAPALRKLLVEGGATHIGLSFTSLIPRLPKKKPYLLTERFPDSIGLLVDSGGFGTKQADPDTHEAHMERYKAFVEANIDRMDYVTEYDPQSMGLEWIKAQRTAFWDDVPSDKFMPIWHEEYGLRELEELAAQYDNIGVTTSARNINSRLNGIVARYGVHLHGVAITQPDELRDVRFASAMSTSWTSPMRYGETQVWDGHRLRRYPPSYRDQVRRRYVKTFERAGYDPALIAKGDGKEIARFTIWSWLQLEESMDKRRQIRRLPRHESGEVVATSSNGHVPETAENEVEVVAPTPPEKRNSELVLRDERRVLPIMALEQRTGTNPEDGSPMAVSVAVLSPTTQRRCDSCYIAGFCPEFTPGAQCVFDVPVEIRTKDQLLGALTAMLEMQIQRIAFARMAEELEGGYPDPNLSTELDRFMTMTQKFKEIQDNRDFFKMNLEVKGNAGVLSAIFGERVGEQARRMDHPLDARDTDRLLADVVEGEVVE